MPSPVLLVLVATLTAFLFAEVSSAEEPPSATREPVTPDQKRRADDLAVLANVAGRAPIVLPNGGRAELQREPAYRWSNSVGTTIGRHVKDAALFFWMADDRPVAATTVVWYSELGLYQEFLSLAPGPLTASRGTNAVWAPTQAGVTFQPVPEAPSPAANAAGRFSQMKAIAGRFRGEVVKGPPTYPEGSLWQLRLLPRPLVRYGAQGEPARDGAVFALCQDSDPEACLLLEVRGDGDRSAWHFAVGALTSRELKVWYDDNLVWTKPLIRPASDPKRPYYVLSPNAVP
ncbi:MAG TPA: hypothetical protein VM165_25770 [Planctomycetaceae bacterium]|nr:hypothetical protein [Planctomycetaceae bacterium]